MRENERGGKTMKNKRKYRQNLAVLLIAATLLSSGAAPLPVLAENTEISQDSLYDLHKEHLAEGIYMIGGECSHRHTADCYELVEDCIHEHTEDCYLAGEPLTGTSSNASKGTPSDSEEEDDPYADADLVNDLDDALVENCSHKCSVKSGCIIKELVCGHENGEHDETCGYNATSSNLKESFSNMECPLCVIQLRIDKLPDTETLSEMDDAAYDQLYAELVSIWEAIEKLTDKEQTLINRARLDMWIEAVGGIATTGLSPLRIDTDPEWFEKYTVDGISPGNATINLFDYWLHSQDAVDSINWTDKDVEKSGGVANNVYTSGTKEAAHWPRGAFFGKDSINRDEDVIHPFVFAGIGPANKWTFGPSGYDKAHDPGRYNTYMSGSAQEKSAYTGIVQSTLKNGYPVLNLSEEQVESAFKIYATPSGSDEYEKSKIEGLDLDELIQRNNESLDYLFDPEIDHPGKAAYSHVQGLLRQDDDGYYYYDSEKNFAEFDIDDKQFYLFDKPATLGKKDSSGKPSGGQFFPFNSAADVFDEDDGELVSRKDNNKDITFTDKVINHYFGLTLNVNFYQPDGGLVDVAGKDEKQPMQFEFSGDDDVWVFIDGILVADLGGIHDTYSFTIDFATGEVTYKEHLNPQFNSTIRQQFLKAVEDKEKKGETLKDSQGNTITKDNIDRYFRKTNGADSEAGTFRSGTEHTLQFFYLERGNQESNLSLSYNLIPPIADDLVKVDQDNKTIEGVRFALFSADEDYVIRERSEIAYFETGEDGMWTMTDDLDIPYDFGSLHEQGIDHYVLQEIKAPDGYRKVPDIHLKYSEQYNILEVDNTWDTGAVGNFNAKVYQIGDLKYQNPQGENQQLIITPEEAKAGIVLAVPLIKRGEDQEQETNWWPIYGANLEGFSVATLNVNDSGKESAENIRRRVLRGALYQIHAHQTEPELFPSWSLSWSDEEQRYQGTLEDIPGTPERYYHTASDAGKKEVDLAMSYYFVHGDVFTQLRDQTAEGKLTYLNDLIEDKLVGVDHNASDYLEKLDAVIDEVADSELFQYFAQINPDEFKRIYGSHIYVPNALNSLSVVKQDEEGKPLEGVEFGLYDNKKQLIKSGFTDENGEILFAAATSSNSTGSGYVQVALNEPELANPEDKYPTAYYLHEIKTLEGYEVNDTWIPIYVTGSGVYANAGEKDDNILVYSGLGTLLGTMSRYAEGAGINVTLRDLILKGSENTLAQNGEKELAVHYGLPGFRLDYGTHLEENGDPVLPIFITDVGMGYGEAVQNYDAHSKEVDESGKIDEYYNAYAVKTPLGDKELSHLFTGSTAVVIRNVRNGRLTVHKTVGGNAGDKDKAFTFTVSLDDKTVNEKYGDMFFENGVANFTLKHGESKTAYGLPLGVHYTVTEIEANMDGYITVAESVNGDKVTIATSSNASGEISKDRAYALFTNVKNDTTPPDPDPDPDPKTGALTVSKTVTGSRGDTTKDFTFTATLSDASINGTYGDMTFQDGVAVFTLKHGESKTASGLPHGITYTVGESNNSGYRVTSSGAEGTIPEGGTAAVLFNNHRSGGGGGNDPGDPGNPGTPGTPGTPETAEPPSDPSRPLLPLAPGETPVTVQAPPDAVPRTGDENKTGLWLLLAGICGLGFVSVLFAAMRRKKDDEE
ncbi:MAG: DUF5979 domain-containing protein [Eubacteriales bacterium]|nr:DUF5979 domain-containing protein [Eubacteriales bacterium]